MIIAENELLNINGGVVKSISYAIIAGVGAFIALLAGILDGYSNPIKCHK